MTDLERRFKYHKPDANREVQHNVLREVMLDFAKTLQDHLPEGREKSLVFTKLEEAAFWGHAAIAREGK